MKSNTILFKYLFLSGIGAFLYLLTEILYRGYTHWAMAILGGLCFVLVGFINEYLSWDTPLWLQGIIGAFIITSLEFAFGLVLNIWLGLGIWDYSKMPFNLLGQICLPFTIAWFFLAIVAIVLDDWLRHWFFGEEKPRYKLF